MMQRRSRPRCRAAKPNDIPFLARMNLEATLPPLGVSFWDSLLEGTRTETRDFLEAMFQNDASNWGNVEDFIVLELEGEPVATCAVFVPGDAPGNEAPFNLDRLDRVASSLSWSPETAEAFRKTFESTWGGEDESLLKPQADLIIETFAVAPEHRGKGLGTALLQAAFDRGRALGAGSIGIMVIHGNDTARALYEKHFEPFTTFHAAYFNHTIQGVNKYRALLDPGKE